MDVCTSRPSNIEDRRGRTSNRHDNGGGSDPCRVFFELRLNGKQVGGGEISSFPERLESVQSSLGANPEIDPSTARTNALTARLGSNGECSADTAITATRFKVIDFG